MNIYINKSTFRVDMTFYHHLTYDFLGIAKRMVLQKINSYMNRLNIRMENMDFTETFMCYGNGHAYYSFSNVQGEFK